jgi:raffinose synthase
VGCSDKPAPVLSGTVSPSDVPVLEGEAFACYSHVGKRLLRLERDSEVALSLGQGGFELFTFAPVENGFAPIGLADKLNSAAALSSVSWSSAGSCELTLRDGGEFLAYCERKPTAVSVAGRPAVFEYERESRSLRVASEASGEHALRVSW